MFQIGLAIISLCEEEILSIDITEPHKLSSIFRCSENSKISHKKVIEVLK
jgi:hypothetical protein